MSVVPIAQQPKGRLKRPGSKHDKGVTDLTTAGGGPRFAAEAIFPDLTVMPSPPLPDGSVSPVPAPALNCRVWERQACDLEAACRPLAGRSSQNPLWSAVVRDLSPGGIGLIVERRFERGTSLTVEVPETGTRPAVTLFGRVAHVTALPDNRWLIGCAFALQLDTEKLQSLLSPASSDAPAKPI